MRNSWIVYLLGIALIGFGGCKRNSRTSPFKEYVYTPGESLSLPVPAGKQKVKLLLYYPERRKLIDVDNGTFKPDEKLYAFLGIRYNSDSVLERFYGYKKDDKVALDLVAVAMLGQFGELPQVIIERLKKQKTPVSLYLLFSTGNIPKDSIPAMVKAIRRIYEQRDIAAPLEGFYLLQMLLNMAQGQEALKPAIDTVIDYMIKHWPESRYSLLPFAYKRMTKNDTSLDTAIVKIIRLHRDDPEAFAYLFIYAKDSAKLGRILTMIGKLPVNERVLQLISEYPNYFHFIDESDTLNLLKITWLEEFGAPPYLIELWSKQPLILFHYVKGLYLEQERKYNEAVAEFKACDNYHLPDYIKEFAYQEVITILRDKLKDREGLKEAAYRLLSYNPVDSLALSVLKDVKDTELWQKVRAIVKAQRYPMPDVKFRLLEGGVLDKSGMEGKVWVIKFWSIYCPHCRKEIPIENEFYMEMNDTTNYGYLACSVNSKQELEKFLRTTPFYFLQAYGCNLLQGRFGVSGVPSYFVIDKEGNIVFSHVGEYSRLKERLRKEFELAKDL